MKVQNVLLHQMKMKWVVTELHFYCNIMFINCALIFNGNPTSSIRKVVIPENSCPFVRFHLQVTLATIPSGVQEVDVILYERLKRKVKLSDTACLTSGPCTS